MGSDLARPIRMTTLLCFCRWPAAVLLMLVGIANASAQSDLGVVAITQPSSGCALSGSEGVTIRIFNYGPTIPGPVILDIAYSINGEPPFVETILAGTRPSNSFITVTFQNSRADLSAPGIYTIDATATLAGDVNPANNAFTGKQVRNAAPTAGGTLTGPTGITPSGTLSLAGQVGAIVEWQQSTDGARWRSLANTQSMQAFSGLERSTRFRVQVDNAPCAPAFSNELLVNPTDTVFANGFE
jgi:hypothetical protein